MVTISGTVERITYYNPENGYTVLRLKPEKLSKGKIFGVNLEGLLTIIGNLPELSPGESVEIKGDYETHPKHGLQFKANACEKILPVTAVGIERYLGSGLIKGIGPGLAKRIVRAFKEETLQVIEETPQQLLDVPGIGPDRTEKIISAWEEQKSVKEIMLFLHEHQISSNLAVKIYKTYGEQSLNVVRDNPYQLEEDIYGIGFKTADKIAQNLGLPQDHPSRIEAGVVYAINEMINEGHVYSPEEQVLSRSEDLLTVERKLIESGLERLQESDRIRKERVVWDAGPTTNNTPKLAERGAAYGVPVIYLTPFYHSETGLSRLLRTLCEYPLRPWQTILEFKSEFLSEEQQSALKKTVRNPVSVITGGPGTGKTTCLKALIELLEKRQLRYALASPTGRAAKRLSEATERPASTIHRLLGYSPNAGFQHHEKKPLEIDFLIIDEASMLDLLLAYHLLKAVKPGTQLLFVGDIDQLPSVSAGDVLRDIIDSGEVPVSRLTQIFRQSKGSQIIMNAHRINQGLMPMFSKNTQGDFFMFPAQDAEQASDWVLDLVSNRMPKTFNLRPVQEIQVLTPMYRGAAGVDGLNEKLQETLNPPDRKKPEHRLHGRLLRVGDKVMQIRNNYDKDVYNGDIGYIREINIIEQQITVTMDESRYINYAFSETDELTLAYAVSVHKSQGSEFPAVVMPILTQHYVMLQRNLLYTAITRARKLCVLTGNEKAIRIAVNNNQVSKRYSLLSERLKAG